MPVTYRDLTVSYRDPGITYRGLRLLNLVRPGATVQARGRAWRVAAAARRWTVSRSVIAA